MASGTEHFDIKAAWIYWQLQICALLHQDRSFLGFFLSFFLRNRAGHHMARGLIVYHQDAVLIPVSEIRVIEESVMRRGWAVPSFQL